MAIHLGRSSPNASRDRPERRRGRPARRRPPERGAACRSYLVLLPVGFALPPPLPAARCALTAPFHPCRPCRPMGVLTDDRARRCVSVALSLGSPPPGVTRHRASVEPGLSSLPPVRKPAGERPSDRLAWEDMGCAPITANAGRTQPSGARSAATGKLPHSARMVPHLWRFEVGAGNPGDIIAPDSPPRNAFAGKARCRPRHRMAHGSAPTHAAIARIGKQCRCYTGHQYRRWSGRRRKARWRMTC